MQWVTFLERPAIGRKSCTCVCVYIKQQEQKLNANAEWRKLDMANWIELTKTWEFASIRSKWCRRRRPDGGNSWAQNVGPIPDGGWLIPNRFQPPNREPVGRHTCHYLYRKRKEKTVPQNYHTERKTTDKWWPLESSLLSHHHNDSINVFCVPSAE